MIRILTADIGATNSRFASFRITGDNELELEETRWFRTQEFSSFRSLLAALKETPLKPDEAEIAVFAVAGPVEGGLRSSPPFISWDIETSEAKDAGIRRSVLINDFVAQAYACRTPVGESAERILTGQAVPDGTVAVMGAGTALGKAVLIPDGTGGYAAVPSEGGHANFPFLPGRECEFQEFLLQRLGDVYITYNKVVSGRGLSYVHLFLTGEELAPEAVARKLVPGSETLQWGARFYGRACRNYALETLSLGGVYIAGGVAARTPALVTHEAFGAEFRSSPTLAHLLENMPVFLIRDEQSGLWGAAALGLQTLRREGRS
jgi:glucokinase